LRELQQDLNYYMAWIDVESADVGALYRILVSETRRVIGPRIRDAWNGPPVDSDSAMSVEPVEAASLVRAEAEYVSAVRDHLAWFGRGGKSR
jgi:hypothetical protein